MATGAICTGAAASSPGTLVHELVRPLGSAPIPRAFGSPTRTASWRSVVIGRRARRTGRSIRGRAPSGGRPATSSTARSGSALPRRRLSPPPARGDRAARSAGSVSRCRTSAGSRPTSCVRVRPEARAGCGPSRAGGCRRRPALRRSPGLGRSGPDPTRVPWTTTPGGRARVERRVLGRCGTACACPGADDPPRTGRDRRIDHDPVRAEVRDHDVDPGQRRSSPTRSNSVSVVCGRTGRW